MSEDEPDIGAEAGTEGKAVFVGSPQSVEDPDWHGYVDLVMRMAGTLWPETTYTLEWVDTPHRLFIIPVNYRSDLSRAELGDLITRLGERGKTEVRYAWSEDADAPLRVAARILLRKRERARAIAESIQDLLVDLR